MHTFNCPYCNKEYNFCRDDTMRFDNIFDCTCGRSFKRKIIFKDVGDSQLVVKDVAAYPIPTKEEIIDMFNNYKGERIERMRMWRILTTITSADDLIVGAENDDVYLALTFEDLMKASESDLTKLAHSGIRYNGASERFVIEVRR